MSQMTKRALAAALKQLLSEQPLDKITVTDLTNLCEVNRQTFYYHFKDIYDLVDWMFWDESSRALAGQKTYDSWQQGFAQIFDWVLQNRHMVVNVYRSISREQMERYLHSVTRDLLMGVVEEKAAGMSVREEDKAFIADFYKFAFVGLMLEWVRTGMKEEPAQIIARLSDLITGDFTRALEKYRTDRPAAPRT